MPLPPLPPLLLLPLLLGGEPPLLLLLPGVLSGCSRWAWAHSGTFIASAAMKASSCHEAAHTHRLPLYEQPVYEQPALQASELC